MGFCEESKQRHYAMESPAPWKNCHCNPLGSHSKRLSDALSSFVDNLRYCRLSKDTQCCESAKRRGNNRRNTTSNKNRNRQKQTGDFDELLLRKHSRVQPNPYFEDENEETETLLQPVVEAIKSKNAEHRKIGLAEVRRLSRDNQHAKRVLAKLGAIPPLISLLDTTFADEDLQNLVLLALLSLANGNNINKAAIVTAGAIPRLIKVLSNRWDWAAEECVAAAFLSLSTLDVNKPVIGSSGAVALLIKILKQGSLQARKDALEALRNLSVFRGNISLIIEAGVLQALLDMVYNADLIERAVDLLASLIATDAGRNAVAAKPDCLLILVDVLSWVNSPCQDKAISLLTSMACDTNLDLRNTIASSGAVPALLELAILGNSLAQQAAALILDVLKDDVEQESDDSFEDYEDDEDQDDEGWLVHNFFEHNCNDNNFKVHVERL